MVYSRETNENKVSWFDYFSQVEFSADTMRLNLVELGRSGNKMVSVVGHVAWQCHEAEAADPVTFTTREAHLVSFPRL